MTDPPPLFDGEPAIVLITGIQAAGKSTVAQRLAERLPRSVHVRGDTFRRMIVNDRVEMSPDPSAEALGQLRLRYRLTATTCDTYAAAGFTVVAQDVVLGEHLADVIDRIRHRPLYVVVLAPSAAAVADRAAGRDKNAYDALTIDMLDRALRTETPRVGLWLDTTGQTPDDTVAELIARLPTEAALR